MSSLTLCTEKAEDPIAESFTPVQKDGPGKLDISVHRHMEAFSFASPSEVLSKGDDDEDGWFMPNEIWTKVQPILRALHEHPRTIFVSD